MTLLKRRTVKAIGCSPGLCYFSGTTMLFLTVATSQLLGMQPLRQAHAHNDYRHPRPLLDALERGFCSVEADVFLVNGHFLIGHDRDELREDRTLRNLYLEPLQKRVTRNQGSVYRPGCPFTLLIDVKSDGDPAWAALHKLLLEYQGMLTAFQEDGVRQGPVTTIVSGNRAASLMQAESLRYAGLDGRISDLSLGLKPTLMPWISDDFTRFFDWNGEGEMSEEESDLLGRIVAEAHRLGYKLRFWATPDLPRVWQVLTDAGVDLIGTDDLEALQRFLARQEPAAP